MWGCSDVRRSRVIALLEPEHQTRRCGKNEDCAPTTTAKDKTEYSGPVDEHVETWRGRVPPPGYMERRTAESGLEETRHR